MSEALGCWRLEDNRARLVCGPLSGRVEFISVGIHFQVEKWRETVVDNFQVLFTRGPSAETLRLVLEEWYVRGNDLVASFEKMPPDRISPQIAWHAEFLNGYSAVKLEMTLSVRTELLDSAPLVTVNSFHRSGRMLCADSLHVNHFQFVAPGTCGVELIEGEAGKEHLFLFRDEERGLSYAQMTHPSDFHSSRIDNDRESGLWHFQESLFPGRLEKGVIRRGRICGWFLPVENDLATAVELARQFVDEPLPLTT